VLRDRRDVDRDRLEVERDRRDVERDRPDVEPDRPEVERDRPDVERERPDDEREGDGTFAPFSRASDNPIAIACFRLVTRPPCPDLPRFSVPCFLRRIALSTDLEAASP